MRTKRTMVSVNAGLLDAIECYRRSCCSHPARRSVTTTQAVNELLADALMHAERSGRITPKRKRRRVAA